MDLDFTALNNIKSHAEASNDNKAYLNTPNEKEVFKGQNTGLEGLQGRIDLTKAILEEYQDSRSKSNQMQFEILEGLKNGTDITILFLKALETISLITGNALFYEQGKKYIDKKQ